MVTLIMMTVAVVLFGIVMNTTMTVSRNSDQSRDYMAAQAAAEGAVEYAYAVWLKRTANAHRMLSSSSDLDIPVANNPSFSGTNAPPGTSGFVYYSGTSGSDGNIKITPLDKYGVALSGTTPDPVIGPVTGYPGWWGRTYCYAATAVMQPQGSNYRVGVRRIFQYTTVPLFQTMFFFNDDLEISNPAHMTVTGLIHTNANLYLSTNTNDQGSIAGSSGPPVVMNQSKDLELQGRVSYSGTAYNPGATATNIPVSPGAYNYANGLGKYGPYWNATGNTTHSQGNQLTKGTAMEPLGTQIEQYFPSSISSSGTGSTSDANVATGYHEFIEPPSTATTDPLPIAQARLFNQAGLIIRVSGTTRTGSGSGTAKKYSWSDIVITTATQNNTTKDVTVNVSGTTGSRPVQIAALQGASLPTWQNGFTVSGSSTANQNYNNAVTDVINMLNKQLATDSGALYDSRQGIKASVVNLNVNKFDTFIQENMTGNFNGVLYIDDAGTVGGSTGTKEVLGGTTYPTTVRLTNGQVLPNNRDLGGTNVNGTLTVTDGLTVASQNPIYIQGDYNTGTSPPSSNTGTITTSSVKYGTDPFLSGSSYTVVPAAVIGDAVMVLSNNWSDSSSAPSVLTSAKNTTYNTAILGGYINSSGSGGSSVYSGGANNYIRYIEDWRNYYHTYWGSMVQLFQSVTYNHAYVTQGNSSYYPPTRLWNYEPMFSSVSPPGTTTAIVLSRGSWTKY